VVRALADAGHPVDALVRRETDLGTGVVVHALTDSVADAPSLVDHVRPEVVVHLAIRWDLAEGLAALWQAEFA